MPSVMYGIDLVLVEDPGLLVLLEHRPVGVDAPGLDRRLLLLQVLRHAANRAAGADADHQVVDRAAGLVPDLGPGLLVVRLRVRRVVVLVGLPRIRRVALEARRHRVVRPRILRVDVGRADNHFGAERAQRIHLLFRLLVGGGEDALVALDHRGNRQAHAGVARGAFDDGAAGLELAGLLGVLDHLQGHAVLDRVAGVDGLDLGVDVGGDNPLRECGSGGPSACCRWSRGCCCRASWACRSFTSYPHAIRPRVVRCHQPVSTSGEMPKKGSTVDSMRSRPR